MTPDLTGRLKAYVDEFNSVDEEIYPQSIDNAHAFDYLRDNAPLLDCPDKDIERVYYYRWWTLRKHWKETPFGHILTEFHPSVAWAGPYNSINGAYGHHIRESRWLRDSAKWNREFTAFWMDRRGASQAYSVWYAAPIEDYLSIHPDYEFEGECIDKLISLFEERTHLNLNPCGLYWSNDDRDAMEMSISGSGIRPTLNSYMCGEAAAISRMAAKHGRFDVAEEYNAKSEFIRKKMDELLWDGDFYKVIPCEKDDPIDPGRRPFVPEEHNVREEIGYIPWYFGIPGADKSVAFKQLNDENGFAAPYGITTAERRHPRFMFKHEHECLWNGPVWPFATSQTLTGLARHLHENGELGITKADYYRMLRQYALSHRLTTEDGKTITWIDEDMDPFTGDWTARTELKKDNWNPARGGYERGKDYNHSTYCDLVLSGLLGIEFKDGRLTADPIIPDDWDWFCVTGVGEDSHTVQYDRTGEHYGNGKGLIIY